MANIEYKTIRDDFITLLQNNLPTLNQNMTDSLTSSNVKKGDVTIYPARSQDYPAIFISITNKVEEDVTLSRTRKYTVEFKIQALVKLMDSANSDDEMYLFTRNIEEVLRANDSINSNFKLGYITSTTFDTRDIGKGLFVSTAEILFQGVNWLS